MNYKSLILLFLYFFIVGSMLNVANGKSHGNKIDVFNYSWSKKKLEPFSFNAELNTTTASCKSAGYSIACYPISYDFNSFAETEEALWFGSVGSGLIRYDKVTQKMTNWNTTNSGLPDNNIVDLATDKKGNLWIVTLFSLSKVIKQDFFKNIVFPNQSLGNGFGKIQFDSNNNLWVLYKNFNQWLVKYNDQRIEIYQSENPFLPPFVDFVVDSNNTIWIASEKGVVEIKDNNLAIYEDVSGEEYSRKVIETYYIKLKLLKDNSLLLANKHNAYNFKNGKYFSQIMPYSKNYIFNSRENILFVRDYNKLFISDENWLGVEDQKMFRYKEIFDIRNIKGINHFSDVNHLYIDKDDNLYFTTNHSGIFKLGKDSVPVRMPGIDVKDIKNPIELKVQKKDSYFINMTYSLFERDLYLQRSLDHEYNHTEFDKEGNSWGLGKDQTLNNFNARPYYLQEFKISEELKKAGFEDHDNDKYGRVVLTENNIVFIVGENSVVRYDKKKWKYFSIITELNEITEYDGEEVDVSNNESLKASKYKNKIIDGQADKNDNLWVLQNNGNLCMVDSTGFKVKIIVEGKPYLWKIDEDFSIWVIDSKRNIFHYVLSDNNTYIQEKCVINLQICKNHLSYIKNIFSLDKGEFLIRSDNSYLFIRPSK